MKNIYIFILSSIILVSCFKAAYYVGTQKSENIVSERLPVDTIINKEQIVFKPEIEMVDNTKQIVTKGGVTISCELVPIKVSEEKIESDPYPTIVDAEAYKNHKYDRYCKVTKSVFTTYPENVQWRINIRNKSGKILRLHELGLALLVDGVMYDQPEEFSKMWSAGMILDGFDKEYNINGPQLQGIGDQKVMAIIIQDVPTEYDQAGTKIKVESFEWFFKIKLNKEIIQYQEKYVYFNKPVHYDNCSKCDGDGVYVERKTCDRCSGKGYTVNIIDGNSYTCKKCKGDKLYDYQYKCNIPNCEVGRIYEPKSKSAKILEYSYSSISKYRIKISGLNGTKVYVKDFSKGDGVYIMSGFTPCEIEYQTSNNDRSPSFYIEQNKTKYHFVPKTKNGQYYATIVLKNINNSFSANGAEFQMEE